MGITMNVDHPKFSLADEVLLCLPLIPHYVCEEDLLEDFNISHNALVERIAVLRNRGITIEAVYPTGQLSYTISDGFHNARAGAEEYWSRVYEAE